MNLLALRSNGYNVEPISRPCIWFFKASKVDTFLTDLKWFNIHWSSL